MVKAITRQRFKGYVHCPICTHTVGADVEQVGKIVRVVPGQKCPRCSSTLDVAAVLQVLEAA
jgi:Zn ribbon nucleic-acid-binding protein